MELYQCYVQVKRTTYACSANVGSKRTVYPCSACSTLINIMLIRDKPLSLVVLQYWTTNSMKSYVGSKCTLFYGTECVQKFKTQNYNIIISIYTKNINVCSVQVRCYSMTRTLYAILPYWRNTLVHCQRLERFSAHKRTSTLVVRWELL